MKRKSKNSRAGVSDIQVAWLNGEWLLGNNPLTQDPAGTAQALALMSGIGSEALWSAHGDDSKFFWRPGLDQPITREDLERHEASWLESGEGDNDPYGGDSRFIFTYYTSDERQTLWNEFGNKELYHWEPILRRPIPAGASVDAAMVAFADPLSRLVFPIV
jgi:hypothetical protein